MLGCRQPRVRRWRRNGGWSCHLPLSGAGRWPATHRGCNARGACGIYFRRDTPALAPNGAIPMGVQSFFRHADSELLLPGSLSALPGAAGLHLTAAGVLPISLAALAAVALPGVGGLVILTASRGARRIPPGQSRFRIAGSGHRALRRSGAVRCCPFGVIGCRPSEGIARRPSGGVKRRMSSR